MDIDAETVLVSLREEIEPKDPELAAFFYILEDYYERKLWYQLSEALRSTVYTNENSRSIRLRLFDNFISTFGDKINQLQLVEFLVDSLEDSNAQDSLEYLTNLKQRITDLNEKKNSRTKFGYSEDEVNDYEIVQALIFLDNELARVKLQLGFTDEASKIIDQSQEKIEKLNISVDNRVNASFYRVKAQLMKRKGDYTSFYFNSLLFLACIPNVEKLPNKELIIQDIAISGLLGDKIYNFGEIIMHDIFQYLQSEWLKNLVLSLNNGDLKSFNTLITSTKDLNQFPDLANKIEFLNQKVCIMAFIELVFNKPTTNRTIEYAEITEKIPLLSTDDDIERMVMRSLSMGLLRGSINEVERNVEVSWIQPRTMTTTQIENMRTKMVAWSDKVKSLTEYMSSCGGELLA